MQCSSKIILTVQYIDVKIFSWIFWGFFCSFCVLCGEYKVMCYSKWQSTRIWHSLHGLRRGRIRTGDCCITFRCTTIIEPALSQLSHLSELPRLHIYLNIFTCSTRSQGCILLNMYSPKGRGQQMSFTRKKYSNREEKKEENMKKGGKTKGKRKTENKRVKKQKGAKLKSKWHCRS